MSSYETNCAVVWNNLGAEELLCQLAEELTELSMAAMDVVDCAFEEKTFKVDHETKKRTMMMDAMLEEIADVELVMEVMLAANEKRMIDDVMSSDKGTPLDGINWFSMVNAVSKKSLPIAKTALKVRRAMTRKNPTPVTWAEAHHAMIEGLGHLLVMTNAVKGSAVLGNKKVSAFKEKKAERWAKRLTEGVENYGNLQQDPEELLGNG